MKVWSLSLKRKKVSQSLTTIRSYLPIGQHFFRNLGICRPLQLLLKRTPLLEILSLAHLKYQYPSVVKSSLREMKVPSSKH
jgi:hypothetical protein